MSNRILEQKHPPQVFLSYKGKNDRWRESSLHDNAKYGVEEKSGDEKYYTLGEHPRLFKELVKKAGLHKELKGEEFA